LVDTRAYFTAAESFCIFVSNFDVKRLTNKTKEILSPTPHPPSCLRILGNLEGESCFGFLQATFPNPNMRQHPYPFTPSSPRGCCLIFWGRQLSPYPKIWGNTPLPLQVAYPEGEGRGGNLEEGWGRGATFPNPPLWGKGGVRGEEGEGWKHYPFSYLNVLH